MKNLPQIVDKVHKMLRKEFEVTVDGNHWRIGEAHFEFTDTEIKWHNYSDGVVFNRIRNFLKRVK